MNDLNKDLKFSIFPNENFVDLSLYQFGWEKNDPSHSYGPAARNHYLFHYVLSGTGQLMANDSMGTTQTYHIKSGQGFMIFPGQINTYIADQYLPWEYAWIEFDGLRVKESISITGLSPDAPVYHAKSKNLREKMMLEMLYLAEHGDAPPFHLIGHLYLFFDAMLRSIAPEQAQNGKRLQVLQKLLLIMLNKMVIVWLIITLIFFLQRLIRKSFGAKTLVEVNVFGGIGMVFL